MKRRTRNEIARQRLLALAEAVRLAHDRIERDLAMFYPVNSMIEFWSQCDQKNASCGVVVNHPGGPYGYVRVRYHSGHVRDISFKEILRLPGTV